MQATQPIQTNRMQQLTSPLLTTGDDKLVLAAKQDPAKFGALYEKYYPQILRFVYQRVTTKEDAFDITQQVFVQAMLSLHKYESRGFPFSSWLYRITINELNGVFRKNEKRRGLNLDERHLRDMVEEMKEESDSDKEQLLMNALSELAEDDLQIVEMRFFEKRAFKEIAEILDINEATAKMRIYRIMEKLKPEIEKSIQH